MKTTAFTHHHIDAGAKMASFAGYNMPIEFSGIADEHNTVRSGVGIFDVSHMGEIWVKGPNAEAFLQYVTSNDVAALGDGKIQYAYFPNGKGGIVDDFLTYRIDSETYLLVVNAANLAKDWNFLKEHCGKFDITPGKDLYDASPEIAQVAIQGPDSMKLVQKICNEPIENLPFYTFKKVEIAGVKDVIVSATGYTGEKGCEIYMANEDAEKIWTAIWEAGKEFGLKNIGLGARDTLRLEMGFCLYGNDIDETTSPLEAGLSWITKFVDGKDFIDRDRMEAEKATGLKRKLIGFEMIDRGIPRHDYEIVDAAGNIIGKVTSGTYGPAVKNGIGMGYVLTEHSKTDGEVYIQIRNRSLKAKIVRPPFYKK